jgi:hypothetical protein
MSSTVINSHQHHQQSSTASNAVVNTANSIKRSRQHCQQHQAQSSTLVTASNAVVNTANSISSLDSISSHQDC